MNSFAEHMINWWYMYLLAIIALIYLYGKVKALLEMPQEEKEKNVKEYLKYAVVLAEKKLGSKTGALKLRMVYEMTTKTFPWIVDVITFDMFDQWVKDALKWMDKQIESNAAVKDYIERGAADGNERTGIELDQ